MSSDSKFYLGIEGGGTRTVAIASDASLRLIQREVFGPGNPRLLTDKQLRVLFAEISSSFPSPSAIGIGLAGIRDDSDQRRIRTAAEETWRKTPLVITHDLEIALRAGPEADQSVLVLSGTGSCCYGRNRRGRTAKVGGWGHLLGDCGSGYDIAVQALRAAVYNFDRSGRWTILGRRLLRALQLNNPDEIIPWVQQADKAAIAALAPEVFAAAAQNDALAKEVQNRAAASLARDGLICAERLRAKDPLFILAGSVLLNQPRFAKMVAEGIRAERPSARVEHLTREGAWGAVKLAIEIAKGRAPRPAREHTRAGTIYVPEFSPSESPTEQRNPATARFHELSVGRMVDLMLRSESAVTPALAAEQRKITRAVTLAGKTLQTGRRIFYVGAGTSGRLGVLDASECPPTFRASPEMIQGIIAGGQRALWQAVEGAEDDARAGGEAIYFRGVRAGDLVIGIAASGRTPFVWGALAEARKRRAATILICFNPALRVARVFRPDLIIAPNLGPEVLTGSTRLKCGTATKMILNMISTIAMVKIGKVLGNLMIDLNPSNVKLRDRAIRILQELTHCDRSTATKALKNNDWIVKEAWAELSHCRPSLSRRAQPAQNGPEAN